MVGVLILTHGNVGQSLLDAAQQIMGTSKVPVMALGVQYTKDCESLKIKIQSLMSQLNQGDGVLILSDLFGATPYNIAKALSGFQSNIITGANLPMLLAILNHANDMGLHELTEKISQTGKESIVRDSVLSDDL